MLSKLYNKYKNISQHIKYQGFSVFFSSKIYDHLLKYKFKKIGIFQTPRSGDMAVTSAQAINKDAEANMPSSFWEFMHGLKKTGLKKKEISLIDIGCGEGRVLNFGMYLHFKAVYGIDLDQDALAKAAKNCEKMKALGFTTPFQVQRADATIFSIPEDVNLVYLFNPFGEKTMQQFIENLVRHVKHTRSTIHVIYCVPVWRKLFDQYKECSKIFEAQNQDKTDAFITVIKITAAH